MDAAPRYCGAASAYSTQTHPGQRYLPHPDKHAGRVYSHSDQCPVFEPIHQRADRPFFCYSLFSGVDRQSRAPLPQPRHSGDKLSVASSNSLPPSIIAGVQYVGTNGWHQDIGSNVNTLPLNSPFREGVATGTYNSNLARTFPGFSNINQYSNNTDQRYDSLQAGLQIQNKHGLKSSGADTWSHELDITSNDVTTVSNPFKHKI